MRLDDAEQLVSGTDPPAAHALLQRVAGPWYLRAGPPAVLYRVSELADGNVGRTHSFVAAL